MVRRLFVLTLGMALALSVQLCSAGNYPDHPIRWIVPVPAGTSPDITARVLADAMRDTLGPIIINNIPGAGGNIGAGVAARSRPDGYTWFFSTSPLSDNMKFYRTPGYDALKDFIHISHIADYDVVLTVKRDSPYKTLNELVAAIKANPGSLTYSSGGLGTPTHIVPAMLLKAIGGNAMHVPYRGGSDSINALLGGQVTFAAPVTQIGMNFVKSGLLRALAVSSSKRNPIAPDVPTFEELKYPVELTSYSGLSVPAGTPEAIVEKIGKALHEALSTQKVQSKLTSLGLNVYPSSSAAFTTMVKDEVDRSGQIMKSIGLKQQ